jgi:hypothetical protein
MKKAGLSRVGAFATQFYDRGVGQLMNKNIEGKVVVIALDAGVSGGAGLDSITLKNYGIQIPGT